MVVLPLTVPKRYSPFHSHFYLCLVPFLIFFTSLNFMCVRKCVREYIMCVRVCVSVCVCVCVCVCVITVGVLVFGYLLRHVCAISCLTLFLKLTILSLKQ